MKKITAFLTSFAALTVLVNAFVPILPVEILPRLDYAQAAQGGPSEFKVGIGDLGCSSQHRDYGSAVYTTPTGEDYGYVTDENGKDPDCARINILPGNTTLSGGAMYTNDFRIGIALAESENGCTDRKGTVRYTPWASEGGGDAFTVASGSISAADCIWIHYQTRAIPNGSVRIQDVQAGISVGGGGLRYTPWASQGGGWSSYSIASDDFISARIALNVRLNYKYNSSYVSSTIPQDPPNALTKNQTLTNRTIIMKNIPDVGATTAMPWISDVEVSSSTNRGPAHCYEWTPTNSSDTCTQTTTYTSSKFKLRRIDGNGAAVQTTSGDLPYLHTVTFQYGASQVWYEGQCYPSGGGGGDIIVNSSIEDKSISNLFGLIKQASALPPGPGDEICDPPYPSDPPEYVPSFISQDKSINILQDQNATFSLSVTGVLDGSYQLQFQMVNTESNELFGDANASGNANTIARINVRIGAFGMSCTATVTTIAGQTAAYAINATGNPPATVNVTMSNTPPPGPPNATMSNSPLALNSSNSYAGIANVSTTGMTPGTYSLVFTGSGSDGSSVTCPATLQLNGGTPVSSVPSNLAIYNTPSLQFSVNGGVSATVPSGSSVTLSWITTATNSGTGCTASGNWSGSKSSTPGSTYNETVGPLSSGTYTYNLVCSGALGSTTPMGSVTVTADSPPQEATMAAAANSVCGAIDITWQNPASGTQPQFYRVYHNTTGNENDFAQVSGDITYNGSAGYVYSFRHSSPAAASNYYAVRSWTATSSSDYTPVNPSPIAPTACTSNISTSDKDVVSVSGRINRTFTPIQCSGESEIATLPNNALFAPGDVITFQINVCNTGTQVLSGVSVADTSSNLSNLSFVSSTPNGCATQTGITSGTINFSVTDVAANNGVCSIRMTGVVTAPANPSAAIYRFQNRALITASGGISREVFTPPYLFSVSGSAPDRGETPPPQN